MRLGRSLAAAVGTAALVVAGALAGPAAADDPGFKANPIGYRHTPNEPLTVSGVGCASTKEGKPSSVSWSLASHMGAPIEGAHGAEKAGADGTWNLTIDLPAIMKTTGLKDPALVDLTLACTDYNGRETNWSGFLALDSTEVDGTAKIISSDTDGDGKYDAQSFDINFTGFSPGRLVDITVINADITKNETWEVATVTADADGRVTYRGPVPAGPRNDQYYLQVWEAAYYEGYVSKPIQVKDGWWQVDGENIPVDPGKPAPTAAPSAPADPNGTATADPNGTGTATADPASAPKSGLAKTGASLGLAVVAAGLLAAGGIVLFHRRRV